MHYTYSNHPVCWPDRNITFKTYPKNKENFIIYNSQREETSDMSNFMIYHYEEDDNSDEEKNDL